jgi:antitoxin component YwqK of YwqJK toxin-antitoxin module
MKKILMISLFTITSLIGFSQGGWDKSIVNFDKKGERHGYFQVQDTLLKMAGFGFSFKSIDSTGIFYIERLVLDGPAIINKNLKINDTVIGLEINETKYDLKTINYEDTKNILSKNDKIKFYLKSSTSNNLSIVELTKKMLLYRFKYDEGITMKGYYKHGKQHGKWETYDYEGKLINTRIYRNDKQVSCSGNCTEFSSYVDFF